MKKNIRAVVLLDLAFLLLIMISGMFSGTLKFAFYLLAYLAPIAVGMLLVCKKSLSRDPLIFGSARSTVSSVIIFAPVLLVIIGISSLTTLLLSLLGKSNVTDVSGNIFYELFRHALLPAILEEMLFRYIPLRLLLPYSRRSALLVSAIMFSLIHLNLFQIPYALFAGVALAFIVVLSGSILPAILLHALNNAISVFWMREPDVTPYAIIAALAVLSAVSFVFIIKRRDEYKSAIASAFSGDKIVFSTELVVVAVTCLLIAFSSL